MEEKEQKLKCCKCKHYHGAFNAYAKGWCYMFEDMILKCAKFDKK